MQEILPSPQPPIEDQLDHTFSELMQRAEALNVPFLDLNQVDVDREAGRLIPEHTSRNVDCVVVQRHGNRLTVVCADPTNVYIHDHIEIVTRGRYRGYLVLGDVRQIALARRYVYTDDLDAQTLRWQLWLKKHRLEAESVALHAVGDVELDEDLEEARSQPIVEAVNELIREAIAMGASDIHFENLDDRMVIRFRIDGVLQIVGTVPHQKARPYIQRVKIMADMDITNEQLPEGGRLSVTVGGESLDMRVSVLPSKFGENLVLRLLSRQRALLTPEELGMNPEVQRRFNERITLPHGMILVCGPTGSGKSTTLYTALSMINSTEVKVLTVEDPVEYVLPGVTQVQLNLYPREEARRLTFPRALRDFLRHDPDVIMVGEIRDPESAHIATQAALTGHLMFSTVHTNDAVSAIARLKDMRVEPYVVANTLLLVLAQRLVRRVCLECAAPATQQDALAELLQQHGIEPPYRLVQGRGCPDCHETGYSGRTGLFELLVVDDEIRSMIEQDAPSVAIGRAARLTGANSLRHDGLEKVARGITTLAEVNRVTARD